ncbi:MAG: hypothetical protein IKM00_01460 [Clostridia bacterium]|nr:hypothetical protein [Clostridia bacterium]
METNAGNAFYIVEKNLKRTALSMSGAWEKSFAHLREQARAIAGEISRQSGQKDILRAVLTSDEAARIYRESFLYGREEALFGEINRREEPYFRRAKNRFFQYYLCGALAEETSLGTLAELIPFVCEEPAVFPVGGERTVAFLRNGQAMRAFERFAKLLDGVSAVYENNFLNACESVYTGHATFAIIPIRSTADGRLNSFYRQIEKYGLSIVMTCEVDSDDGENTTTFALVYKDLLFREMDGEPVYECKITFDDLNALADIADAASYYGAALYSVEALPILFSGRAHSFSLVFGLQNADFRGLFAYLALEYPQTAAIGIYRKLDADA